MKRNFFFAAAVLTFVGCTDTIDTVTREYRNTTNELIDALMMIRDEASAKRMKIRVIEPVQFRYRQIDGNLKTVRLNRTRVDYFKEVTESDGFQLYVADLEVNLLRYNLELARLRNLVAKADNPGSSCPTLFKICEGDTTGKVVEFKGGDIEKWRQKEIEKDGDIFLTDLLKLCNEKDPAEVDKLYKAMTDATRLKLEQLKPMVENFKTRRNKIFRPNPEITMRLEKAITANLQKGK